MSSKQGRAVWHGAVVRRIALCLCLLLPAILVAATESVYAQRLQALLTPLLGEHGYRLHLQELAAADGGRPPLNVLLVLNSQSPAVQQQGEEGITALVKRALEPVAGRDQLVVSTIPFYGVDAQGVEPAEIEAIDWRQGLLRAIPWLTVAVLLALLLAISSRRRLLQGAVSGAVRPQPEAPGEAQTALSYDDALAELRSMATQDPARVAQVLRQWINSGE